MNDNKETERYSTPSELLENYPDLKNRFKNAREIGYFLMTLKDKIDFFYTNRSVKINTMQFIAFIDHVNAFEIPALKKRQ